MSELDKTTSNARVDEIASHIASIIDGIQFGSVEIVIHDGKIVQIERREKLRLDAKGSRKKTLL